MKADLFVPLRSQLTHLVAVGFELFAGHSSREERIKITSIDLDYKFSFLTLLRSLTKANPVSGLKAALFVSSGRIICPSPSSSSELYSFVGHSESIAEPNSSVFERVKLLLNQMII
jgi:hypothetical protein